MPISTSTFSNTCTSTQWNEQIPAWTLMIHRYEILYTLLHLKSLNTERQTFHNEWAAEDRGIELFWCQLGTSEKRHGRHHTHRWPHYNGLMNEWDDSAPDKTLKVHLGEGPSTTGKLKFDFPGLATSIISSIECIKSAQWKWGAYYWSLGTNFILGVWG